MIMLRRHRLVRLTPAGWDAALGAAAAGEREVLALWRHEDGPLVVARQDGVAAGRVRLGLPAPAAHARRRVALAVACADLREAGSFPEAGRVAPLLAPAQRLPWRALVRTLGPALVFGSYGWQALTGQAYVHARSDLDLLLPATDAEEADALAARLAAAPAALPRLDGELAFADGSAVAWREWLAWRAGRAGEILVKRIDGVRLERGTAWLDAASAPAPASACAP